MTLFEKIASGEVPASFVMRDDKAMAFMDIHPMSPGHVLVCPLHGVDRLDALERSQRDQLWELARRIGAAQRQALGSLAQHLLVNDGREASQSVPHVHIHVIPRYRNDRIRAVGRIIAHIGVLAVGPPITARKRARLDDQAARIARALDQGPD